MLWDIHALHSKHTGPLLLTGQAIPETDDAIVATDREQRTVRSKGGRALRYLSIQVKTMHFLSTLSIPDTHYAAERGRGDGLPVSRPRDCLDTGGMPTKHQYGLIVRAIPDHRMFVK